MCPKLPSAPADFASRHGDVATTGSVPLVLQERHQRRLLLRTLRPTVGVAAAEGGRCGGGGSRRDGRQSNPVQLPSATRPRRSVVDRRRR